MHGPWCDAFCPRKLSCVMAFQRAPQEPRVRFRKTLDSLKNCQTAIVRGQGDRQAVFLQTLFMCRTRGPARCVSQHDPTIGGHLLDFSSSAHPDKDRCQRLLQEVICVCAVSAQPASQRGERRDQGNERRVRGLGRFALGHALTLGSRPASVNARKPAEQSLAA